MLPALIKNLYKKTSLAWFFLLDLLFPIECLGCGREGVWLCPACSSSVKLNSKQSCLRCKRENIFGEFCADCRPSDSLNGVWIAASYDDQLLKQLIKNFKYKFIATLAEDLAKLMILFFDQILNQAKIYKAGLRNGLTRQDFSAIRRTPSAILDFQSSLIVPVPLSRRRYRWRGFNQAEKLGEIFSRRYGLEINSLDLARLRSSRPQAKLKEADRPANVKNCFVWRGGNLTGKNIILIDDVVTTGATLQACARILKANGAGEVWGLVVAKG